MDLKHPAAPVAAPAPAPVAPTPKAPRDIYGSEADNKKAFEDENSPDSFPSINKEIDALELQHGITINKDNDLFFLQAYHDYVSKIYNGRYVKSPGIALTPDEFTDGQWGPPSAQKMDIFNNLRYYQFLKGLANDPSKKTTDEFRKAMLDYHAVRAVFSWDIMDKDRLQRAKAELAFRNKYNELIIKLNKFVL